MAIDGKRVFPAGLDLYQTVKTDNWPKMKIFVAGLSYKTTPVELREKLAVSRSRLQCCGCRLKLRGNLSEVVLLSTCNRVEIYGVSPWIHGTVHRLFQELTNTDLDFTPYLYVKEGAEAAQHLFSVASGLDSMVIGETEITGQVKNAYEMAKAAGLTGKKMNQLFQAACSVVKKIRTETAIGRGATSVGSVAVELAEKVFDRDLSDKTVMILGAGKMGEACVKHLAKRGAKTVLVFNRSFERAEKLAVEFGGRAVRLEDWRRRWPRRIFWSARPAARTSFCGAQRWRRFCRCGGTVHWCSWTSRCPGTLTRRWRNSRMFFYTTLTTFKRSSAKTRRTANRNSPYAIRSSRNTRQN